MSKVIAIIPAGGAGLRIGGEIPKQYMVFRGKELIAYTLDIFERNKNVDEIIISAQPNYYELLQRIKSKYNYKKIKRIVEGGKERQYSVYNALTAAEADEDDLILVHDAARPLLPQIILDNVIMTAKEKGNAVVAIKAKDTLVKGLETIINYISRENISYVQTPQIFSYKTLLTAMQKADDVLFVGTDESMIVTRIGEKVNLVEGSSLNFKVTTESDVELLHHILESEYKF